MTTTNTTLPPKAINREYGSESHSPTSLIATTQQGHETIYLGQLNASAILRVWAGGYRVLVKNKAGTWSPGHGLDDTTGLMRKGAIAPLVERLTGRPVTKAGADLLDKLPASPAVAHRSIVQRGEARLAPLKYVSPELQLLRDAAAFRGL